MKPTPPGWPRLSASLLYYRDPARMIDWLCEAFGFTLRLRVDGENGGVEHSELCFGADSEALIMVGSERIGEKRFGCDMLSPLAAGGNTQGVMLYADDVDAHCARSRATGTRIVDEPSLHDYGADYWADRSYGALDPEGHL